MMVGSELPARWPRTCTALAIIVALVAVFYISGASVRWPVWMDYALIALVVLAPTITIPLDRASRDKQQ